MYGLNDAQLHSETASDTHVLVAWSADTILLAFRGTVTKANVLADFQVGALALCTHLSARGLAKGEAVTSGLHVLQHEWQPPLLVSCWWLTT